MISKPQFEDSLKKGIKFLQDLKLFKAKSVKFGCEVSKNFKEVSTSKNFVKIYDVATANNDFDIILSDDSIFQMKHEKDILRYAFLQNPRSYLTLDEFAETIFDLDELQNILEVTEKEEFYSLLAPEYEKYKETEDRLSNFNYFRYDFSELGYSPNLHSTSHFHIGMIDDVRIPVAKYVSPAKFIKFCIKNTYYKIYKEHFKDSTKLSSFVSKIKSDCIPLSADHWKQSERDELHLF
ncbi:MULTISPECIES: DUF2290 domain-containing protein [Sphingobacterium]|uniref:DUF2290 domain-containing protein n=1 Tax=Sphingobacterium TaxID=28453 RepID=UPI00257B312B|nr:MULTISPECIES: DUF2290 domain-containing protein [Sphingobacterium]